ncbi:hypothetical protein, partial [Thiolapillus sp.]|uniref:hypothetical protein n=1 Tax=Thiolapillus sp. TaxID=2017437 RepID=UPI003AF9441A
PRLDISGHPSARGGGDSLTRPRLDISGHPSARGGGDSLTRPRLDISGHPSARGGAILLLAPGWTSLVIVAPHSMVSMVHILP